jgi:zinc transport system permease protein
MMPPANIITRLIAGIHINMDDFVINALLAGVALALVAGPLGCVVVWRRMAYFGDTLAHAALLGVALAVSAELLPQIGVALVGLALAVLLFWLEKQREISTDTLLGILSHSALALGLIVLSIIQRESPGIDLMAYLFGDILAINRGELGWMYLGVLMITLAWWWLWPGLLSISVHEDLARTDGVPVTALRFAFMLMLALVIAVAINVVGILLVTALLIIPAASARLFSRTPVQMALLATFFATLAVISGLGSSLRWDVPAGPMIVVMAAAIFFIARLAGYRQQARCN